MNMNKLFLLILAITGSGMKAMDVPLPSQTSSSLASLPATLILPNDDEIFPLEIIPDCFKQKKSGIADIPLNFIEELAQSYVTSFSDPIQAVNNLKNFLQTKKEWRGLLSDPSSMRKIAEIIEKKYKMSFLNALFLLNTNGSRTAYNEGRLREIIKKQVRDSLFHMPEHFDGYDSKNNRVVIHPEHKNANIIAIKDTILKDRFLLDFFAQEIIKAYGQSTLASAIKHFTGREDLIFLDLLFCQMNPTEFQKCQEGLQFLLSKAIININIPLVRELLHKYHVNPNAPITVCIPHLLPGQGDAYRGLTPMHFAYKLKSNLLRQMILDDLKKAGGIIPDNYHQLETNLKSSKQPNTSHYIPLVENSTFTFN